MARAVNTMLRKPLSGFMEALEESDRPISLGRLGKNLSEPFTIGTDQKSQRSSQRRIRRSPERVSEAPHFVARHQRRAPRYIDEFRKTSDLRVLELLDTVANLLNGHPSANNDVDHPIEGKSIHENWHSTPPPALRPANTSPPKLERPGAFLRAMTLITLDPPTLLTKVTLVQATSTKT